MDTKVRREDSVRYITLNIHLFLQRLEEVDKSMRKPNQTPVWVSKFSYLSLLNLPDQITSLGSMRSIWDGGFMGEGYLPHVKAKVDFTKPTTWPANLLKHSYQGGGMERSLHGIVPPGEVQPVANFKCYRTLQAFESDFHHGRTVSVVDYLWGEDRRRKYCVVFRDSGKPVCVRLKFRKAYRDCGVQFLYIWVCDDDNDRSSFDSSQLNGCQVLLPEMRDKIPCTAVFENPPPDGVSYQVYHWVADRWHPFNTLGSGSGSAVPLLGPDEN
jgi:hypothetical protein